MQAARDAELDMNQTCIAVDTRSRPVHSALRTLVPVRTVRLSQALQGRQIEQHDRSAMYLDKAALFELCQCAGEAFGSGAPSCAPMSRLRCRNRSDGDTALGCADSDY
jgi:hypothetical protein